MSKKASEGVVPTEKRSKRRCKICVADGAEPSVAKKCDGVHHHEFCGAKIVFEDGAMTCEAGHPEESVTGCVVKTKQDALKDFRRW